jgi:dTDP-4-dehydrorhamnose 3,5-epimerase
MTSLGIRDNPLPGVFVLDLQLHKDPRGLFVKTYNEKLFAELHLDFKVAEVFHSVSAANVLRGMHYQTGTSAHSKLVYCLSGEILDVVVGIDPGQSTFNKCFSINLNTDSGQALLIGKGYAHGFLSLKDNTLVNYMTSTIHDPAADSGVLWSSICFDWPIQSPILSARDQNHPPIHLLT